MSSKALLSTLGDMLTFVQDLPSSALEMSWRQVSKRHWCGWPWISLKSRETKEGWEMKTKSGSGDPGQEPVNGRVCTTARGYWVLRKCLMWSPHAPIDDKALLMEISSHGRMIWVPGWYVAFAVYRCLALCWPWTSKPYWISCFSQGGCNVQCAIGQRQRG